LVSEDKRDDKIKESLDNKFIAGIHSNIWNKIKHLHILKNLCGLDDIFDIENFENTPIIDTILLKLLL